MKNPIPQVWRQFLILFALMLLVLAVVNIVLVYIYGIWLGPLFDVTLVIVAFMITLIVDDASYDTAAVTNLPPHESSGQAKLPKPETKEETLELQQAILIIEVVEGIIRILGRAIETELGNIPSLDEMSIPDFECLFGSITLWFMKMSQGCLLRISTPIGTWEIPDEIKSLGINWDSLRQQLIQDFGLQVVTKNGLDGINSEIHELYQVKCFGSEEIPKFFLPKHWDASKAQEIYFEAMRSRKPILVK